jgi:hypothetical protein
MGLAPSATTSMALVGQEAGVTLPVIVALRLLLAFS